MSPQEKEAHRLAERELKEAKAKMTSQVKVRSGVVSWHEREQSG